MMIEGTLLEKLRKIEALHAGTTVDGEREATRRCPPPSRRERGLPYWADPGKRQPNQINTHDGGRGVYWNDPNGHVLEIITRPYGSGG